MATLSIALSVCLVTMATAAMEGVSNKDDWAYQWYTGEPFRFKCQTSGLNFTGNNYAVWDTPTRKALPTGHNESDYQLKTVDGMRDVELLVKDVKAEFHGVYTCYMYDGSTAVLAGKVIYGLNIHDVKYHDMSDKYSHNIVVAVISTAVFVGPLATIFLVWHFQYEKRHERKNGLRKTYEVEHEMKGALPNDGIAETGKGAYENPNFSTQL